MSSSSRGGSSFFALVGAFIAGSVVTYAATQVFGNARKNKNGNNYGGDDDDDGDGYGNNNINRNAAAIGRHHRQSVGGSSMRNASQISLSQTSMEHVNFMSDVIDRLWPHINAAGSAIIRSTVEPMFADMMPAPFKSLHFQKVDLGKIPIRIDNVVVHELHNGLVQMDMDVLWDSDSDIQLKADYMGIAFGVRSIQLNGRMTFHMKPLGDVLPIVGAIQYGFINPPTITLHFTGLASIADFSVVSKTIQAIVDQIVAGMMVLPNRMTTKLDPAVKFMDLYQPPRGVVRVTCARGRGFEIEKILLGPDDIPDVYCKIKLGVEDEWITSVVEDNLSPVWNESYDYLLSDKDQILSLEAWDEDKSPLDPDDFLGRANVTVGEILLAGKTLELALMGDDHKPNGAFITLHCEVYNFTHTSLKSLEDNINNNNSSSSSEAGFDKIRGLKTIIIAGAYNIPPIQISKKDASTFVKVIHGRDEFITSIVVDGVGVDALNPVFDTPFLIKLNTKEDAKTPVQILLMTGTATNNKLLAKTEVKYDKLIASKDHTVAEKRKLSNGASLDFAVKLSGVDETSPQATASSERSMGGVGSGMIATNEQVRITIREGHGFKARKRRLKKDDIPDIYVQIKFGSSPKIWRTQTIDDSVKPKWKNEFRVFDLGNLNQIIHLDAYDENRRSKDTYLGAARITVGKVLLCGGSTEVELQINGVATGAFILLSCDMI